MIHARSDYNCIQPWPVKRVHIARDKVTGELLYDPPIYRGEPPYTAIIPDDEPVFLIRGQDLAAIPAAEAWCAEAERIGTDGALVEAMRRHIELVRDWQTRRAKVPDAPANVLD